MKDFETEVSEGIDTLQIIYSSISTQYKKVSENLVNHKFAFEKSESYKDLKSKILESIHSLQIVTTIIAKK